jgi:hypothetical protein
VPPRSWSRSSASVCEFQRYEAGNRDSEGRERPDNRLGPSHPAPLREDKVAADALVAARVVVDDRALRSGDGRCPTNCFQLPAYEEYFGLLRSPLALRFFRRFPLPQDLVGHNVEMMASLLVDLATGKVGPHKGGNRLIAMRSKAQAILETSGAMRALPRTLALELKAELIQQGADLGNAPPSAACVSHGRQAGNAGVTPAVT